MFEETFLGVDESEEDEKKKVKNVFILTFP